MSMEFFFFGGCHGDSQWKLALQCGVSLRVCLFPGHVFPLGGEEEEEEEVVVGGGGVGGGCTLI